MCAYCDIKPQTQHALDLYAPNCEYVDTSATIWDYGKAIASRWTGEDDLVVIEDDKEITAEVLPSFANCGHLWCSYSYLVYPPPYQLMVEIGLGCTRYSAQIQRIVDISEFLCADDTNLPVCKYCAGKGCWNHLDVRIAKAIRNHQDPKTSGIIDVHCHGEVLHHHNYSNSSYTQLDIVQNQMVHASKFKYIGNSLAGPAW
jgi:hypothetical protein